MAEDKSEDRNPQDTAETLREEARMPAWRFLVIELRKLLIPVMTAAIAGGGAGFLGWNLHGRFQAKDDAASAAHDQVKSMEELRNWIRDQRERETAASVTSSGVASVTTLSMIFRTAADAWGKGDSEKQTAAECLLRVYEADVANSGKAPWGLGHRPDVAFVIDAARNIDFEAALAHGHGSKSEK